MTTIAINARTQVFGTPETRKRRKYRVSKGYDPQTAYKQEFKVKDFHTLTAPLPLNAEVTFKIRHTPEYHPATIEPTGDGEFIVHSSKPIHGVAPGQFCVVYDQQHHRCYGSGEITL